MNGTIALSIYICRPEATCAVPQPLNKVAIIYQKQLVLAVPI